MPVSRPRRLQNIIACRTLRAAWCFNKHDHLSCRSTWTQKGINKNVSKISPMDKSHMDSLQTNEEKEKYVIDLCKRFVDKNDFSSLIDLLTSSQKNWEALSTARLTKVIKTVFEYIPITFNTYESVLVFLNGLVQWAGDKKMLRLDLECKLIHVYLAVGKFRECLEKIAEVSKELKKYDDKVNLISLYVFESRAYYELQDFSRARSSLTSARAMAVSSACPAQLQAQIDLLNGMYLCDERSFDTSVSYFIESLESFLQDKQGANAKVALRYIILSKILAGKYDDALAVLDWKSANSLKDDHLVRLLCHIAKVCKKRDLKTYSDLLHNNRAAIEGDNYIFRHLRYLYNVLLDNNILKIIEPYSHVKVKFVADKLGFPEDVIEDKLRNMILDKSISGILDHVTQCLVIYQAEDAPNNLAVQDINVLKEFFKEV